ncbi:MAG: hypothetical protein H6708_10395 [Kofleriaceae bacterium]|nr:hypothetical protein [Myxococcales bacterium]MCB9560804.1 hypothetical protein [Kofleriaceae bacterium]
MKTIYLLPGVVLGLLAVEAPAHAYISDSDACGYAPASWDVPKGAAVASRAQHGSISRLMDAIGEYYSHQMMAHGNGWISHATMKTPGVSVGVVWPWNDDQVEGEDIKSGWPGASQVDMGATYHMLYRDGGEAGTDVKWYDGGADGAATADWLWGTGADTLPYCGAVTSGPCWTGATSQQDGGQAFYLIARKDGSGAVKRHGYGFYQYQNSRDVVTGDDASSLRYSQHCSTLIAWGYKQAVDKTLATKTYGNAIVGPAAYTLHDSVASECEDAAGWFGSTFFVDCDDIADQIVNCFTAEYYGDINACDDDGSSRWHAFASAGTARSTSPDMLVGRNQAAAVGAWVGKPAYTPHWNSGGNVYGCFF